MRAQLSVIAGQSQGATLELSERGVWRIGRDPHNDLHLNDLKASRQHCRIESDGQYFWLMDEDSVNGTFVNDEAVHRYMLYDGDVVKVGMSVLVFKVLDA